MFIYHVIRFDSERSLLVSFVQSQNTTDKPETLTLYNVTKKDEGWYVCVALNYLGNATAKGYLSVVDCKY